MQEFIASIIAGCVAGALVGCVLDWWDFPNPIPACVAWGAVFGLIAGLPVPVVLRWTLAGGPIGYIVGLIFSYETFLFPDGFSTLGHWISVIVGMIVCGVAAAVVTK